MGKHRRKRKTIIIEVTVACCVLLLLYIGQHNNGFLNFDNLYTLGGLADGNPEDCELAVHFIDVGQGDSIFIDSPDADILVDCGERDKAQVVLDYLTNLGVTHLDLIVATHPHTDHIGGMPGVLNSIEADAVLMPMLSGDLVPTTSTYEKLLRTIKEKKIKAIRAKAGTVYTYGDLNVTVLAPVSEGKDLNNNSVMLRLEYKRSSFLLTGDAEKSEENTVLKTGAVVASDVIKLGHHGSSTSCDTDFMNAVVPQYAVISCGVGNDYGHPHEETLEFLDNNNIKCFRTDIGGTIVIGTDGYGEYTFNESDS